MQLKPARPSPSEGGFVLIEVLVSALVLAIAASGVLALLQATTHSAGEQRDGSKGYAVAQEDQARLRAMRLNDLDGLEQMTHPKLDGTTFTVESTRRLRQQQRRRHFLHAAKTSKPTTCGSPRK